MTRSNMLSYYIIVMFAAGVLSKPAVKTDKQANKFERYMVKFKEGYDVDKVSREISQHFLDVKWNSRVKNVYKNVVRGMSIEHVSKEALDWIMEQEFIEYVEESSIFQITGNIGPDPDPVTYTEGNFVNWGLDRITERTYTRGYGYEPTGTGDNIDIFVIDTEARINHPEFRTNRLTRPLFQLHDSTEPPMKIEKCSGHGTQTSGVAGGLHFGTATKANIKSIPVMNCHGDGTSDDVLAGLELIKRLKPYGPGVIIMSISSPENNLLIHDAIVNLNRSDFVIVAAAGNDEGDACFVYPAGYNEVLTVGAINKKGKFASYSNSGDCVDIYAPGSNIYTATNEGNDQIKLKTGTSLAAPFVAGAAAILLEQGVSAATARSRIIEHATTAVTIKGLPGHSHNRILYIEPKS